MSSAEIESARQQWRAASRRLEELRGDEPRLYHRLVDQVGAVVDELRRRIGGSYTLDELVRTYHGAERWVLSVLEAADQEAGWERHASLVADAAFGAYASGAVDYRP